MMTTDSQFINAAVKALRAFQEADRLMDQAADAACDDTLTGDQVRNSRQAMERAKELNEAALTIYAEMN